jgi:hypothetical protein
MLSKNLHIHQKDAGSYEKQPLSSVWAASNVKQSWLSHRRVLWGVYTENTPSKWMYTNTSSHSDSLEEVYTQIKYMMLSLQYRYIVGACVC